MQGNSNGQSVFREEAMQVLLKYLASEESSDTQLLSAFILSNLGGTYAWTGEPYTVAWLVKKAGLTSSYHRNMIRNFNWLDKSLQVSYKDKFIGFYSNKISITKIVWICRMLSQTLGAAGLAEASLTLGILSSMH